MARIRSIKPEFWTDEKVVSLSPLARLLFIGMWNFVDDEGRADYSPMRMKMQILPADSAEITELLGEIRRENLIEVYSIDNKEYFQVRGFAKHQKVDARRTSKLPPPPVCAELRRISPLDQGRDQGKEGIKEGSEANASGASAPVDFEKLAFQRGKQVLGQSAGGVIARLKREKCKTWAEALSVIEEAATKQSPMEWVQGVLKKADPDEAIYRNVL